MMARATRSDVARTAGVAPSTVSLILGGRARELGIAEATEANVRAAAEKLGYIPNAAARALRTQRSTLIAIILPQLPAHPYMPVVHVTVVAGLQATEAQGYNLLTVSDQGAHDDTLARIRALVGQVGLAGVVSQPFADPRIGELLQSVDTPVVWMSPSPEEGALTSAPHVYVDENAGIDELIAGLNQSSLRQVVMLHGPGGLPPRIKHAASALATVPRIVELSGWEAAAGQREATELLRGHEAPTLLWCASDILATGAMRAVSSAGLAAGVDVDVVGYGDATADPARSPELTSVHWPLRELVTTSVEALINKIHGADLPARVAVPTSVFWGSSARRR